jgi:hypothetical protein
MKQSSDDVEPGRPTRGILRWLSSGNKRLASRAFRAAEDLFSPAARESRIVLERQGRIGMVVAAPTDPPDLTGRKSEIVPDAVQGSDGPFVGRIVVPKKPDG